jgi:hypothetical protein
MEMGILPQFAEVRDLGPAQVEFLQTGKVAQQREVAKRGLREVEIGQRWQEGDLLDLGTRKGQFTQCRVAFEGGEIGNRAFVEQERAQFFVGGQCGKVGDLGADQEQFLQVNRFFDSCQRNEGQIAEV